MSEQPQDQQPSVLAVANLSRQPLEFSYAQGVRAAFADPETMGMPEARQGQHIMDQFAA